MTSKDLLAGLAGLLVPRGCLVCRSWIPAAGGDSLLCRRCRTRLLRASWPRCPRCHHPTGTGRVPTADCLECSEWPEAIASARYAFVLESPASDLAHALKYDGWSRAADEMGLAMAAAAEGAVGGSRGAFIVPMPTTPRRVRSRGYNQAALLAASVSREIGVPVLHALERPRSGRSQTSLDPGQRRENVRGAFRMSGASPGVHGATILLVDDILTTGATAGAAATVLRDAGAADVHVVTFARAMPRRAQHRPRAA